MKKIKCPICNDRLKSLEAIYLHLEEDHDDDIPDNFTPARYYYYLKTGRMVGKCRVCGGETEWNDSTNKYMAFCSDRCKDKYVEQFKKRMINKYGKESLLNDPNHQRKMLSKRKISGEYKWSDGSYKTYTGSYELDCLKFLDSFMNYPSEDVICPSPHTYTYKFENEDKFYIPDIFIPSLNLEIEIKESDNNHPHMIVDREKERLKDNVLNSQKDVDYIKIVDKKYDEFFKYLENRKKKYIEKNTIVAVEETYNQLSQLYCGSVLTMLSKMDNDIDNDCITEASIYEKRKNPVYIMLMRSDTPTSTMIHYATGDKYSHVNISFDSSMRSAYSFGLKTGGNGFKIEDIKGDKFFSTKNFPYALYVVFVTDSEYKRMKKRLQFFIDNESKFKFNVLGLIYNFFNIKHSRNYKMFCSQFVADVLNSGRDITNKDPSLVRPMDFSNMNDCYFVTDGNMKDYSAKKVDKITEFIQKYQGKYDH